MASYFGRYSRNSQPVALFSAPPSVALGAPPSLALRAPPSVALRGGLGAVPTVALGAAPVVRLGGFYGPNAGESESDCRTRVLQEGTATTEQGAAYYCSPQSSGSTSPAPVSEEEKKQAEEKTREWTGADWESLFKGLGAFTKPVFDNLGRLIDPNTGRQLPLDPAMAMQYRMFLQQQQNRLPEWVLPVAVIAGIGILAMVVMKK